MLSVRYNKLLCDISKKLDELNDIEGLTFMCRGMIAEGSEESIINARALFVELERRDHLGIDCLDVWKEMLKELGESELLRKVLELESTREEEKKLEEERQRMEGKSALILSSAIWAGGKVLGAVKVRCNFRTVGGSIVAAGAVAVLRKCSTLPEFMDAFTNVILPAATKLCAISEGSVCFTVQAENLSALQMLWQQCQDGTLQKKLQDFLITEEINKLADGQEVIVNVSIVEQEYKEACLGLMIAETIVLNKEPPSSRRRRNSDPTIHFWSMDVEEEVRQLRISKLSKGPVKENPLFEDQGEDMEPKIFTFAHRYVEKAKDSHSLMSSGTVDSGLGRESAPFVLAIEKDSGILDVQQLFRDLRKEAECPLCLDTVNKPKTLPCLHSFCLECLDKLASFERRKLQTTISCPVCLTSFQIPKGDTFVDLPTSFHLNRLVDLLALRDGSPEAQICSNCEGNNTATCYCFVCQIFLCTTCFEAHQRLKPNRGHRNVLIQNLQAQDVEGLMHRPVMCTQKYHETESLEYYCRECKVCTCHKCGLVESHKGHTMVDMQQAAEEQKMQILKNVETMKAQVDVREKEMKEGTDLLEKSRENVAVARRKVRATVEGAVRVLKDHESAMMNTLHDIDETQQRCHAAQQKNSELSTAQLRSSVEYGEAILQRNISAEILQTQSGYSKRCEELLAAKKLEVYKPPHVDYVTNEEEIENVRRLHLGQVVASYTDPSRSVAEGQGLKEVEVSTETNFIIETRTSEGKQFYQEDDHVTVKIRTPKDEEMEKKIEDSEDGKYQVIYKPDSVGQHDVAISVNGQPITGSPWNVQVTPHKYQTEFTVGSRGKGQGQFDGPFDIAVSERTGNIAVADYHNKRIQMFSSERKYLREFGRKGPGAESLGRPTSVAFTRFGDVIVVHDKKISLLSETGQFFKHVINEHLKDPRRVSVGRDGHLIVSDEGDKTVKVLSPDGTELLQFFSAPYCDESPRFAVYHQHNFFASYFSAHCVKVFNKEGVFLYDIGSAGSGDGQLDGPRGLAVDNFNNLIVCDQNNSRLQVFTLDGQFVSKTDQNAARLVYPRSVAVSQDGHVLVADTSTNSVHVLK